jgi:SAM-dependent methyltransferase
MLEQARASTPSSEFPNVSYVQAPAEQLGFVEAKSVDMVVAAQAAHWFDQSRLWQELARVVRTAGSVAFWGYNDHVLVEWPRASRVVDHYSYGEGRDCMGRYWPQPGRSIVRANLRPIVPPEKDWKEIERWEYRPGRNEGVDGESLKFMEAETTVRALGNACRTWSAYHVWMEDHDVKPRDQGGEGDVVDVMLDEMAEAEGWEGNWMEKVVKLEWGSVVLMAERR